MYRIEVKTKRRIELVEITSSVLELIKKSMVAEGLCIIYVPHTTAGLIVNENYDPNVSQDILEWLNSKIPIHARYSHTEGNADAHIKSALVGNSLTLIVEANELLLGRWQGIFLAEYDGPRQREVWVKVIRF